MRAVAVKEWLMNIDRKRACSYSVFLLCSVLYFFFLIFVILLLLFVWLDISRYRKKILYGNLFTKAHSALPKVL